MENQSRPSNICLLLKDPELSWGWHLVCCLYPCCVCWSYLLIQYNSNIFYVRFTHWKDKIAKIFLFRSQFSSQIVHHSLSPMLNLTIIYHQNSPGQVDSYFVVLIRSWHFNFQSTLNKISSRCYIAEIYVFCTDL